MFCAKALRGHDQPERIIALLQRSITLDPRSASPLIALAEEFSSAERLEEADLLYRRALELKEDHLDALLGRAFIARRRRDGDAAREFFSRAVEKHPKNKVAVEELIRELLDARDFQRASEVIFQALARQPDHLDYRLQLGRIARESGDFATARDHFAKLAEIAPDFAPAHVELAGEDFRRGDAQNALANLETFSAAHPDSIGVLHKLAEFLARLQNPAAALAHHQKVLAINPQNLHSILETASLQSAMGAESDAEQTLLRAETQLGNMPEIALRRLDILFRRGCRAEAREVLRNARRIWPLSFDFWLKEIGDAKEMGAFDGAEQTLASPPFNLSPRQSARCDVLRAQINEAQWRSSDALACYLAALQNDPTNGVLYEHATKMALIDADVAAAGHYLSLSKRHDAAHLARYNGQARPSQSHLGQLLDEYRIDSNALTLLRQALSARDPVGPLAALTRERPDYTPAAISLLVALRRTGRLNLTSPTDWPIHIPKVIIQYWDGDIPSDVAALCQGWRDRNPDFSYELYGHAEARDLVAGISRDAVQAYDRAREAAMKADIFRLAALFAAGGCYIDADDRCIAPLAGIFGASVDLGVAQEEFGTIGNNFIAAKPGHPVLRWALEEAVHSANRGDNDMIWLSTGPGVLTRSVGTFLAADLDRRLPTLTVLEPWQLRRHTAPDHTLSYKQTGKHWLRAAFGTQARKLKVSSPS
jgi:mannosyltransferase OCH1-like enzyme/Tfp pilus assembly protein PilF